MDPHLPRAALRAAVLTAAAGGFVAAAHAETLIGYSIESRMQIDLAVPDAAIKALIPAGWEGNVATTGAAKDANVRLIFVDQIGVAGPDGKPVGAGDNQFVFLQVPVKQTVNGQAVTAQLVVGGIAVDPAAVPNNGFTGFTKATDHKVVRTETASADGTNTVDETWSFTDGTGQHFEISVAAKHNSANRGSSTQKIYAADGKTYQSVNQVNMTDITWNATTGVNNLIRDPVLKASGPTWAKLFDGSQKILSVDYQPWFTREISTP
jgi:hypothetical protein